MKDMAVPRITKLSAGASLLVLSAAATLALGACSDSVDVVLDSLPDGGDTGTTIPPLDATSESDAGGSPDASDDASSDADASARICSDDGFCHSTVPKGQNLVGVWGDGTGIVWAVSRSGGVLRWDGTSWNVHTQLTSVAGTNYEIWGSGPADVWVLTPGGLFHGEGPRSAELVFAPVDLPGDPSIPIRSIGGTGPNDIWAVGGFTNDRVNPWVWKGRVLHYDGDTAGDGSGWTVDETPPNVAFSIVRASADGGAWLVGQEYRRGMNPVLLGALFQRPPGSSTWVAVEPPRDALGTTRSGAAEFTAAGLSLDNALWLGGWTNNGGVSGVWRGTSTAPQTFDWSFTQANDWERPIVAFWGTGPSDTWGVGGSGLVTHWNGTDWQQAIIRVTDIPVGKSFNAIWGKSNDDLWVVGDEVALHRTPAGKP